MGVLPACSKSSGLSVSTSCIAQVANNHQQTSSLEGVPRYATGISASLPQHTGLPALTRTAVFQRSTPFTRYLSRQREWSRFSTACTSKMLPCLRGTQTSTGEAPSTFKPAERGTRCVCVCFVCVGTTATVHLMLCSACSTSRRLPCSPHTHARHPPAQRSAPVVQRAQRAANEVDVAGPLAPLVPRRLHESHHAVVLLPYRNASPAVPASGCIGG